MGLQYAYKGESRRTMSSRDTRRHVFTGNSNIHIQLKSDDYVSFIRTIAKAPRRKLMFEGSSTRLGGGMGGGLWDKNMFFRGFVDRSGFPRR